jgi:hypothetical protein
MKIRLAAPTSPVPVPAYLVGQPGISTETRSALAAISQIHGRVEVVHDQSNVFQGGRNRGWTLDQAAVLNALSGDHLHRATMAVTRADHQRPQQEAFFKFAERIGYRVLRHAPLHDERGRICEDEMKVDGACRELIRQAAACADVDVVVVLSGDGGLVNACRAARRAGKDVFVLCWSGTLHPELQAAATATFFLDDLRSLLTRVH